MRNGRTLASRRTLPSHTRRWLHRPGRRWWSSSAVMRTSNTVRFRRHPSVPDYHRHADNNLACASLTAWVCVFCPYSSGCFDFLFFFSWTSWWRLAGCILCQRRVEEIGFRQCALLCKGISHTACREKEETQSENTLNFMTEGKKKDFYTQFIGGKKSVNKKLLKKMVIYYAWHPELQLW